jgi:hypothetical protein
VVKVTCEIHGWCSEESELKAYQASTEIATTLIYYWTIDDGGTKETLGAPLPLHRW